MKKKILALLLVVVMVVVNSVVAFGDTTKETVGTNETSWNGSSTTSNHQVDVVFKNDSDNAVYSVDITWGNMLFTYTPGTWLPSDHNYSGSTWSIGSGVDNDITVTNHSNRDVYVKMAADFTGDNNKTGQTIYGEFSTVSNVTDISSSSTNTTPATNVAHLEKGILNKKSDAKYTSNELKITGDIGNDLSGNVKAGNITITLSSISIP